MRNNYSRRGMGFEDMINRTIDTYRTKNLALIQKIPTPISPGRYNKNTKKLDGSFFEKKSTVDYIGVAQEVAICFDAKEIKGERFPIANIKKHQIDYMRDFEKQGGVSFILLYFYDLLKVYYIPYRDVINIIKKCKNEKKSSFHIDELDIKYMIDIKGKSNVPFLQKVELDINNR